MQILAPVFSSLLGEAGASSVAAAGASSTLGTISTVLGVGAGLSNLAYQNRVAGQAAAAAEENKQRVLTEGQLAQKEQDQAAAEQIAAITAAQAQSGFSTTSPSYERVQARNRILARRDAARIRQNATDAAQNYEQQRTDALNSKQGLFLPLVTGALKIRSSLISGASLVSKAKAGALNNVTRAIPT